MRSTGGEYVCIPRRTASVLCGLAAGEATRRDRIETDLERLATRVELSRLAITRAAWLADQRRSNRREASVAKAHGPVVASAARG